MPAREQEGIRRILVCQLRQIGDVLLATPAIRLLAERFPQAELDVLTEPAPAQLLEGNPYIGRVWLLDRKAHRHMGHDLAFAWRVARADYDLVVDFQQLPRLRWVVGFAKLQGAPWRLTHDAPWCSRWLYSHATTPEGGYAAKTKASVLAPLGIAWDGGPPEIYLRPEERAWAENYLLERNIPEGSLVTVDPTHRRATRRWGAERFGRLLALAQARRPGIRPLVLYGPGEEAAAHAVAQAARQAGGEAFVPDRVLTLREMAAVVGRARLHVGTCSAPRHVAAALGTPSLVVHGATGSAWTCPATSAGDIHADVALDLDCRPCNLNSCPDRRCLEGLSAEMVLPTLVRRLDGDFAEGGRVRVSPKDP